MVPSMFSLNILQDGKDIVAGHDQIQHQSAVTVDPMHERETPALLRPVDHHLIINSETWATFIPLESCHKGTYGITFRRQQVPKVCVNQKLGGGGTVKGDVGDNFYSAAVLKGGKGPS